MILKKLLWLILARWRVGALMASILVLPLLAWWLLPRPQLMDGVSFSKVVRDRNGELLRIACSADGKYRIHVDEVPAKVVELVVGYEDKRYWEHAGVNLASVGRAVFNLLSGSQAHGGASTLTMQVARLRYHLRTRSLTGKIWQILKAIQIERHFSKEQILGAYFDLAPYGRNVEGIGAASLIYFGKSPGELNRQETAALVMLPQSPARRAPRDGQEPKGLIQARHRLVSSLGRPADSLDSLPLRFRRIEDLPFHVPHAVSALLPRLEPESRLTIDLRCQEAVRSVLTRFVSQHEADGIKNAASLVLDTRTMETVAYVGSADYSNRLILGQNDGTRQRRSPGSALKPFVYALALEQGLINPSTLLYDAPGRFGNYTPENYDRAYDGPIPARVALAKSRNLPAVQLASSLRTRRFYDFLAECEIGGLRSSDEYGLSAVLGTVDLSMQDLVRLYAALVNGGRLRPLRLSLADPLSAGKQVLSAEAAFLTCTMLQENSDALNLKNFPGAPIGWKTGTSNGFHDAWCVGVIGDYVVAVWIGNFNGRSNPSFLGRTAAEPLFAAICTELTVRLLAAPFKIQPPRGINVRQVDVCAVSGCLPGAACQHLRKEWIIPGVSPINICRIHRLETGPTENWDSQATIFFQQAGLARRTEQTPERTNASFSPTRGPALRILNLPSHVGRDLVQNVEDRRILLQANSPAGSKRIYWFANREFLGTNSAGGSLNWQPRAGSYAIFAIDDLGNGDAKHIVIDD